MISGSFNSSFLEYFKQNCFFYIRYNIFKYISKKKIFKLVTDFKENKLTTTRLIIIKFYSRIIVSDENKAIKKNTCVNRIDKSKLFNHILNCSIFMRSCYFGNGRFSIKNCDCVMFKIDYIYGCASKIFEFLRLARLHRFIEKNKNKTPSSSTIPGIFLCTNNFLKILIDFSFEIMNLLFYIKFYTKMKNMLLMNIEEVMNFVLLTRNIKIKRNIVKKLVIKNLFSQVCSFELLHYLLVFGSLNFYYKPEVRNTLKQFCIFEFKNYYVTRYFVRLKDIKKLEKNFLKIILMY